MNPLVFLYTLTIVIVLLLPHASHAKRIVEITATAESTFIPALISVVPGEEIIFRINAKRSSGNKWSPDIHGFQIMTSSNAIVLQKSIRTHGSRGSTEWHHGTTDIVWNVPLKEQSFTFSCYRPCGRQHTKMTGIIVVSKK